MCRHSEEDLGLICRIARYHNVDGHEALDGYWQAAEIQAVKT